MSIGSGFLGLFFFFVGWFCLFLVIDDLLFGRGLKEGLGQF